MLYGKCEGNTQRMITKRFTLVTGDHIEERIIQNIHLQSEFSKVSSSKVAILSVQNKPSPFINASSLVSANKMFLRRGVL